MPLSHRADARAALRRPRAWQPARAAAWSSGVRLSAALLSGALGVGVPVSPVLAANDAKPAGESALVASSTASVSSAAASSGVAVSSRAGGPGVAAAPGVLRPCRVPGFEHDASCGFVRRPLDPAAPQGRQIDVHFAVLPALARHKHPDPVFLFAGGPGQSAIDLAGTASRLLARLSNRRDIVLVDQRGTGRSAPLMCPEVAPTAPMARLLTAEAQGQRLAACREALRRLPHGDLRHYTTWIAMGDFEAVREALGAPRINLLGVSYGTRAALEYQRQFPQAVRRVVMDGVVPPDLVLPATFATDNLAALEQVLAACEAEASCRAAHPALRAQWQALVASLPREVTVAHPVTGMAERFELTAELLLGLVRGPLYVPSLAAGLPAAMVEASRGRLEPLVGLASALLTGRGARLAEGMHHAVVCSEDAPRLEAAASVRSAGSAASGPVGRPGGAAVPAGTPAIDLSAVSAEQYRRACDGWPKGEVPAAFYAVPPAPAPALLLSGGADPATPPRHAERAMRALGARARHVVVPQAGHGVMGLPCMRDVLFRFIDAPDEAAAMAVPVDCAAALPRPPAFVPPGAAGGAP